MPIRLPDLPATPPEAWEPLIRFSRVARRPLDRFLAIEAASGILLLVVAALAMVWANSPWAEAYAHLWHTPLAIRIGSFQFERSFEWFINDCLMVIFFFVVGLEIRREIHHGELSEWKRAALPAGAALGGMLVPAAIYLAVARHPSALSGWGVPMATDIAFAVGVLALLGKRVPPALRVLLLALAIIDDLGAILVIALFYSSGIAPAGFAVAGAGVVAILLMQRLGVRSKAAYVAPGVVVWAGIYAVGIHPTIAGVVVGMLTPVRAWLGPDGFVDGVRRDVEALSQVDPKDLSTHDLAAALKHVDVARREALSPAESLIEKLHPWVAFGIMPIFALANAGVALGGISLGGHVGQATLGVVLGLVLGKPLGILVACWCMVRLRIGVLPTGIGFRHLAVLGVVAGVGFTMALFIAQLAFTEKALLDAAKLGILVASAAAGLVALAMGRFWLDAKPVVGAAESADEAEASTTA
jgi:NhaA family Na+:H+ antiporter